MTNAEKIQMVKTLSGETSDDIVSAYLNLAGDKICRLAYPFDTAVSVVPYEYEMLQCDAAVYLLNKRGGEGETTHEENGVNRQYENADLPASMLRVVVPHIGVPR